ncbi:hypothetical protein J7U46_10760 [Pelomonas sp. V22]|uniref:hypothetical protein n=1 Tax=Pelomonas sp. V22 TaxID=2822139 RepID=UPI0024A86209|nr:hypothetical protein [Pelomonas sp. V22]MDI4633528.1 hypothetical protein [Pelomonas sp. V22]
MKFVTLPRATEPAPLLPPDFRSEAFAEDLLEPPRAAPRGWSLVLLPLGLAVLGGALPLMQGPV